jgi:hypothetical protein
VVTKDQPWGGAGRLTTAPPRPHCRGNLPRHRRNPAAYETGSTSPFSEGTHSNSKAVMVNVSVSNWLNTPNLVAVVRCGPKIS